MAVVAGFFVCWAPFHAQRLLAIYYDVSSGPTVVAIYKILTYVSGVLYYASTCVNPLLYNIMSNKFREAFKVRVKDFCMICKIFFKKFERDVMVKFCVHVFTSVIDTHKKNCGLLSSTWFIMNFFSKIGLFHFCSLTKDNRLTHDFYNFLWKI